VVVVGFGCGGGGGACAGGGGGACAGGGWLGLPPFKV
jgi:hypothetical protein